MFIKQNYKKPVPRILILIDDCLASDEIRAGYAGKLALWSTFSRHSNICCIWTSQIYTRLPNTVRQMTDLIIYLYCNPVPERMIQELFNKSERDYFTQFLKNNFGKDHQYSFLMLDLNASNKDNLRMYQNGQTHERYFIKS